jgi:ATP-dependent Clp protease ATP-binding subunit ClpC
VFERFTDRARQVIVLAQEEARRLNHNYIGTEHLLLGLTHEDAGLAAQAMARLDIEPDSVRRKVEEIVGQGMGEQTGQIPFTPRAKKVLEHSFREALQLNHDHIGTEHILLGLMREEQGVAAQVLESLGGPLPRIREVTLELLQGIDVKEAESLPGSAPASARPAATDVIAELEARVDGLEERLAAVEARLDRPNAADE